MARPVISFDAHERALVAAPAIEALQHGLRDSSWSRSSIDELVGSSAEDTFSLTHSGAEAIQRIHWTAFMEKARKEGQCHFITGPFEDAPMLQSLKRLEELGCFAKIAPVDPWGRIDLAKLSELLNPRVAMLSISAANALTGVVQPIEEIAQLTSSKGVWLHVDASYGLGKMEKPFAHVDYLSFAGSMLHAIPSSGGVVARKGLPLTPLILAEPEDPASSKSLSTAATHALLNIDTMNLEVVRLRDLLASGLSSLAKPLFQDAIRLPNVLIALFPGIHQEMLHHALKRKNLMTSIGGAYAPHLYRQLMACGYDESTARTAMSFSLSRFNTEEEVVQAIQIFQETVPTLASLTEDLFP